MVSSKKATPRRPHVRHEAAATDGASPEPNASRSIDIVTDGDLVLRVEHDTNSATAVHSFRVNSASLKSESLYFQKLLQPGKFVEAAKIQAAHEALRQSHRDFAQIAFDELPVVQIQDLGRTSAVKAMDLLMTDFLLIVHGKDIQGSLPVTNLANLAIVADRFDALGVVRNYAQRKKLIRALDAKVTPKEDSVMTEDKVRQRLLIGLLLDFAPWVAKYSARLIMKGWLGKEVEDKDALWWDLPFRLEEEMMFRRDCILETIQSLQKHFVKLYMSRERQCKLFYDSSAQCDSFQLGEMIRFFARIDVLRLQGTLFEADEPAAPYSGDILNLLDSLRQVPEYQIDKFHTHCGIRTRMVPLLAMIQEALQHVGVCLECWIDDRRQHAWIEAHRPLTWNKQELRLRTHDHRVRHTEVRSMFMANEREWDV